MAAGGRGTISLPGGPGAAMRKPTIDQSIMRAGHGGRHARIHAWNDQSFFLCPLVGAKVPVGVLSRFCPREFQGRAGEVQGLVLGQGAGEVVSLVQVAAHGLEMGQVGRCFHALGDDAHAQGVPELADGLDDGQAFGAVQNVADEAPADFQIVESQALDIGQGGIPRSEVVHGQGDAQLPELAQGFHGLGQVLHERGLGQFQLEVPSGDACLTDGIFNLGREIRLSQLAAGNVHGHDQLGVQFTVQARDGCARFLKDPFSQGMDNAHFLGHGDELVWRHPAAYRMLPANKGLESKNAVVAVHDGLIFQKEFTQTQCLTQIVFHVQQIHGPIHEAFGEDLEAIAPTFLGPVHGDVAALDDLLRVVIPAFPKIEPQTGRELVFPVLDEERLLDGLVQAAGDGDGVAGRFQPVEDDQELVAAIPANRVRFADGDLEPPGDETQQLVAHGVPLAVIDDLEAVHVHEKKGKGVFGISALSGQGLLQAVLAQGAVAQGCQRIVQGHVSELFLHGLALADIQNGQNPFPTRRGEAKQNLNLATVPPFPFGFQGGCRFQIDDGPGRWRGGHGGFEILVLLLAGHELGQGQAVQITHGVPGQEQEVDVWPAQTEVLADGDTDGRCVEQVLQLGLFFGQGLLRQGAFRDFLLKVGVGQTQMHGAFLDHFFQVVLVLQENPSRVLELSGALGQGPSQIPDFVRPQIVEGDGEVFAAQGVGRFEQAFEAAA